MTNTTKQRLVPPNDFPSPAEIASLCAAIRAGWTPSVERSRRGLPLEAVDWWTPLSPTPPISKRRTVTD